MIESNLAYDYVGDIPWEKNPAFAFSKDSQAYLTAFRNVFPTIPMRDQRIAFSDDIWDFNSYFININDPFYKFIFTELSPEIKDYFKFFVLYGIMGKRKISTIATRYSAAKSIVLNIFSLTQHNSIYLITNDDIEFEIHRRNVSNGTAHALYEAMYQVCCFLINNYKMPLLINTDRLKELGVKYSEKGKAENSKLPDIPDEYFNAILTSAIQVMRESTQGYNFRVIACAIVMLSQLGMRLGDLLALTITQLFFIELPKTKRKAYYIHYKAHKPSKPHDAMLEFDIFSNALCTEAYQTLLSIRSQCEFASQTDFLIILNKQSANTKIEFPLAKQRFLIEHRRFIYSQLPKMCQQKWDGINDVSFIPKQSTEKLTAYFPDTRQYRVHLCTKLYEHGIPLAYIQRYMGHLSEYMLGYYVRPKDTYQESIKFSEKVIKEIAAEDFTPLGGVSGPEIKTSIQKFIADNHFNVETDIEAIVKSFGDKVIIRGKTGGVCIKTSLMPCARDTRTNEMFCAYNLCPNLFHFFYMADISYMDFRTLQQTYETMRTSKKDKAAQKELNKLKDLCHRRLIPELNELDKELERKGQQMIIERYPSLVDIVENRTAIQEEVESWMMKI